MTTTNTSSGGLKEYFLLSNAAATAKRVPEDARASLARELGISRQRAEAADALWSNGHTAEGLRLAAEAFRMTLEVIPSFAEATGQAMPAAEPPSEAEEPAKEPEAEEPEAKEAKPDADADADADLDTEVDGEAEAKEAEAKDEAEEPKAEEPKAEAKPDEKAPEKAEKPSEAAGAPGWTAVLRGRGLAQGKIDELVAADKALSEAQLPALDDEVSAGHGELFQELVAARRTVDRALSPAAMTPSQLAWMRTSRLSFAVLALAVVAAGLYFALRTPTGVEATASARFGPEFSPDKVVDGDVATEWLLPDRQAGWVEVAISPPQRIETLRVTNAHNRHYNDRATNEYTIEVYSNGAVARTIEASWPQFSATPQPTAHELGVDDVERVRVNVRSWHRSGGGLAEVEWE